MKLSVLGEYKIFSISNQVWSINLLFTHSGYYYFEKKFTCNILQQYKK
jgi:hypothetical protein